MTEKIESNHLYDVIYYRRSVRNFENKYLDFDKPDEISKTAKALSVLLSESNCVFQTLNDKQVKEKMYAKAPHYLAVYAECSLESLVNDAIMLQQRDLWLSARSFGSCWVGILKPPRKCPVRMGCRLFSLLRLVS